MKKNYLKRHSFYVDSRISLIAQNIFFLHEEDQNQKIREIMKSILSGTKYISEEISEEISELHAFLKRWSIETDGDLAGYIYLELQNKKAKNKKGQYFTPAGIVSSMTEKVITKENYRKIRILDPACGSGQFLISAFQRLLPFYLEDGISPEEAGKNIIRNSLFGIDYDETAVEIARYNLAMISGVSFSFPVNIIHGSFLSEKSIFEEKNNDNLYDCILGNPPWGSSISSSDKIYYRKTFSCAKSGINTFTLFLEKALGLLKDSGRLSFLLPEAYLNIKAHQQSREDILSSCIIEEINIWGEQFQNVFAPSISLFLQKDSSDKRKTNIVKVSGKEEREKNTYSLIPQAGFIKNPEYIFNVKFGHKAESIINLINSGENLYLKKNASFFLGIVTGNNEKHIFDHYSEEHPDPIITGKDLLPFYIKNPSKYFRFTPEELQQTAQTDYYKTKNKFLYKFIGSRLTFAYDEEGFFSLNNVNGFISKSLLLKDEALLAILNSSLIQYYYQNMFFTVKVLKGNLERIPIRLIKKDSQMMISSLVNKLKETNYETERKIILESIDDVVFHEYGIKDRDSYSVYSKFNPALSSQSLSLAEGSTAIN
ncbi:MAG TPA: N-6 DNA methylase [Spirochaetota bacterium]|nr:N-6 DNA methylase [Spirochaetota bacterium]HOH36006.1 N-6 DNA methylase [Spirochaetota bacterium]HPY01821.1 N-6 DNA methylase [Spirochaetota bacterium]HQA51392.1 N-6 DNA methylase [Spirochaetota bacterium]